MKKELLKQAKKIRLFAMDVDGVLTAGEIIVLDSGEEIKIWNVKDRMGFAMLRASGLPIKTAWITARRSKQVEANGENLGIDFIVQKCVDKRAALLEICEKTGVRPEEAIYVGDDWVDFSALKAAGFPICPPDSPSEIKKICRYVTGASGGKGAVREIIEMLLSAQNGWKKAVARFMTVAVLFAASGFLMSCTSKQKALLEPEEKPDQWVEKFTITETRSGLPMWVLNAGTAQVYNKRKKVMMDDIEIQFMNPSKEKVRLSKDGLKEAKKVQTKSALLSAPKGEVATDTHDLSAWGGVHVRSQDGTELFTERLSFSSERQKIYSDSPVRIVRGDSIVIGEGLESSPDLSTVKIFRHKASIVPKQIPMSAVQ